MRPCDVLLCGPFKYYYRFRATEERVADGIGFWLKDGTRIVKFPVQHSGNCTEKHKATSQWFKPTVRIYKNMRTCMVDRNMLQDGDTPSYFIEGMLRNVPADKFGRDWKDTFVATFNHVNSANRLRFECATRSIRC